MSAQGRLLIVDDELSVRDSLAKWFHEEGYEVTTAENGKDALTCLAESRWDAALVDIKMHGIDGVELQRRMHEIDPELIVIMMTGYASVETAVTALKNGAYDYVTKPLDPDEIAHLVRKALAHKRTEQENVRLQFEGLCDCHIAILGFADDLKAGLIFEHVFYAEAHYWMIVSDNDTNRRCCYTCIVRLFHCILHHASSPDTPLARS